MNTTNNARALVAAHNLLGRMLASAQRAGDVGREFVVGGVRRLITIEITFRRTASAEATAISCEVQTAEHVLDESLANDGIIDATEATRLRAALRKPEREARHLAAELEVKEVVW